MPTAKAKVEKYLRVGVMSFHDFADIMIFRFRFRLTFCLKVLGMTHLWPLKMIPSCTASSSLTLKYSETSFGTELLFSGHPLKITFLRVWSVGSFAVSSLISLSCCSEIAR